jgi:spermidine synthase
VCEDAEITVQKDNLYNWIILDLFSQEDAPNFLFDHKFYQNIRNRLKKGGWLFINFLSSHPSQLEQLQHLLITNFGKKPTIHAIPDYLNHIIAVGR